MDNSDETFQVFCWRFNVQKFAYVSAYVGIVYFDFNSFADYSYYDSLTGSMSFLGAITCAFIILAQKNKNPKLYLPYLVFQSINIAIIVCVFLCVIYAGLALPPWYLEMWQEIFEEKGNKLSKDELILYVEYYTPWLVILVLVYLLVASTIYYLVFKAYRFLKRQYELQKEYKQLLVVELLNTKIFRTIL